MSKPADRRSPRLPEEEWARASAAGELEGSEWVEVDMDPWAEPFSVAKGEDGTVRFRHMPYIAFMPDLVREAVAEAHQRGELTLMESAVRMMARPEWTVRTRHMLWTPISPVPALLSRLVESFGIDPEVHQDDPARLMRIAARLQGWHARRGELPAALSLLEEGAEDPVSFKLAHLRRDGPAPVDPPIIDEVMACRSLSWWKARASRGAKSALRIEAGLVRFQSSPRPSFRLIAEDVLVSWSPGTAIPRALLRLLPPWTTLRLVAPRTSSR